MWDTAGQERYSALVPLYFRDASLALIVVDITSRFSLDSAKRWIEYLKNHYKDLSYLVVGTKLDLIDKRTVYQDDLNSLPTPIMPPISVSSLSSRNIPALKSALTKIMGSDETGTPPRSPRITVQLNEYSKSSCCYN